MKWRYVLIGATIVLAVTSILLVRFLATSEKPDPVGAAARAAFGAPVDDTETKRSAALDLPTIDMIRDQDPEDALALANRWRTMYPTLATTLTAEAVVFRYPDGGVVEVPLPEDKMLVAVAPYLLKTHPCETHSISGCQGEFSNREFDVTVTDSASIEVISGPFRSQSNGFIELWLPRDQVYQVTISAFGQTAKGEITTFSTSATCKTEFKLS